MGKRGFPIERERERTRSRSRSMPVPVPVPAAPGAVPTRCRPVAILTWNGIGTDRSSHCSSRSSGRCCPFPFPFLAVPIPVHCSWVGMVTDLDFFWPFLPRQATWLRLGGQVWARSYLGTQAYAHMNAFMHGHARTRAHVHARTHSRCSHASCFPRQTILGLFAALMCWK